MSDNITKLIAEARDLSEKMLFFADAESDAHLVTRLGDALESVTDERDADISEAREFGYEEGVEAAYCAGLEEWLKDELLEQNPYRKRRNDE